MKRFLKFFLIVLSVLILVVGGFAAYVGISGIPTYEVQLPQYEAHVDEAALERGKKLSLMLCAGCHMNPETGTLAGTRMLDAPPEFGVIYAANITQDKQYGIGEWTDAEILYLLRTGIKKDGAYAPPYMAKLPKMADEDLNAIIALLKSDDKLVAPDNTRDPKPEPSFLTKMLSHVAWKPFPMPEQPIPMPDTTNTVELGHYLAHNLDCFSCHSADFKTNNFMEPEKSEGYFGGGNLTLDREGQVRPTANLTPDELTGIGNWTKDEFIRAVRFGLKEGEPALQYPMMPYTHLTNYEVAAIYDYLITIPPIENKVNRAVNN